MLFRRSFHQSLNLGTTRARYSLRVVFDACDIAYLPTVFRSSAQYKLHVPQVGVCSHVEEHYSKIFLRRGFPNRSGCEAAGKAVSHCSTYPKAYLWLGFID